MSEMSAVMRERDHQADEHLKLMSDMMPRRDANANTRMVDLMTTMQELTLVVRAIVSQTAAAQKYVAPAPPASNQSRLPSTSAAPSPTQTTYREIAQRSVEQTRPPMLIPPATYKRVSTKASKMARAVHAESRDSGTEPMVDIHSIDPFPLLGSERASLEVAFGNTLQEPIPLYVMIDTVSILSLSVYQTIASADALSLLPYDIQLNAANDKTKLSLA